MDCSIDYKRETKQQLILKTSMHHMPMPLSHRSESNSFVIELFNFVDNKYNIVHINIQRFCWKQSKKPSVHQLHSILKWQKNEICASTQSLSTSPSYVPNPIDSILHTVKSIFWTVKCYADSPFGDTHSIIEQ